ncbi:helix-turn-helix domain-containing protein [Mangrovibacterium diazotrophicum]|uniref:AlpA family transcriptional regulator n=1 Tax=Mangrovibacterium diazotrophicum TaxID=1261403 RepID=A0A419W4N7_9BACT|nr:helix-turn-helix domain-containing protein [Mangrovibacterium diazotrophicum]RKD90417.1 AlpA family transcriptional regulator [Mangrovibacterium diazotrophicum]
MERLENIESLLLAHQGTLTLTQAAEFTGLSKSTLYKLTASANIPHYKCGKIIYFDREELEAWMKRNPVKMSEETDAEASKYVTLNNGGNKAWK